MICLAVWTQCIGSCQFSQSGQRGMVMGPGMTEICAAGFAASHGRCCDSLEFSITEDPVLGTFKMAICLSVKWSNVSLVLDSWNIYIAPCNIENDISTVMQTTDYREHLVTSCANNRAHRPSISSFFAGIRLQFWTTGWSNLDLNGLKSNCDSLI